MAENGGREVPARPGELCHAAQARALFRTARSAWYVQLGKKQVKLHPGPKTAATEKAAWAAFHELMAAKPEVAANNSAISSTGPTVADVFDKFLDWCQKHREPRTYEFYRGRIPRASWTRSRRPGWPPTS